jgi:acyl carrier protein
VADSAPRATPARNEVLAILAAYGERTPEQVPEDIDSMELAWLVHQLDQRYGRALDADDAALARMATVTGVVDLLAELGCEPGDG